MELPTHTRIAGGLLALSIFMALANVFFFSKSMFGLTPEQLLKLNIIPTLVYYVTNYKTLQTFIRSKGGNTD